MVTETKTYGKLVWHPKGRPPFWELDVQPHVAIIIKRLFSRVRQGRTSMIRVNDTDEVARDLEWFLQRYPLEMDDRTSERLHAGAAANRELDETVVSILNGAKVDHSGLQPAREPRDYQRLAADLAISTKRLLVTDEVGLGKTMTGLLVLQAEDALPALVVVPAHLPRQWKREVAVTFPTLQTHIVERGTPYDLAGKGNQQLSFDDADEPAEPEREPDILIITYSKLAGWADHLQGKIRTVVFDEAQELRRNESQKYKAAAMIAEKATYRCGLSATPIYNYGGEIHNVVSVLDPDALGTRDEFIREWGAGSYSHKVRVRDPDALGAYLRDQGLMLGRTRKQVGRELPDEIRVPTLVDADQKAIDDLSDDVAEMAKLILDQTTDPKERWRMSADLDWKMRQITGIAKAPYVAEFVKMLLEMEQKVVLFGWHRQCYDIWNDRLRQFDPVMYTGSETPQQKENNAQKFLEGPSRVLMMSLRSAQGLNGLQDVCKVAVFGELDWSPQIHDQAIGRLRRDGQDINEPVLAYFLHTEDGADPVMMEALGEKRAESEAIVFADRHRGLQKNADPDRLKRLAQHVLERRQRR